MPQLYGFFEHAIGNVSTGGNGCKYLFGDGMTAIAAVNGRYCGKLVQVGEQVYPGRQGFIAPLGWKREYIDEINKATYHLAERNRLESLENFVKKTTNCQVKQNSTVNLSTLKIFFICAFGSCFLLLVHMRLNPQKIHDNEALQSSMHNQAGDLTNMVNVEEDSSMV